MPVESAPRPVPDVHPYLDIRRVAKSFCPGRRERSGGGEGERGGGGGGVGEVRVESGGAEGRV